MPRLQLGDSFYMVGRNPWDVAKVAAEGDQSEEVTFAAVGRALTKWELLEQKLAWIFRVCVTDDAGNMGLAASRAFGASIAHQGRAAMLSAAAEAFFGGAMEIAKARANPDEVERLVKLKADFKEMLKLAGKYAPRRNEIAHGYVREWSVPRKGIDNGYRLFPSEYATNKHEILYDHPQHPLTGIQWPDYVYSAAEINAYAHQFEALAATADGLSSRFLLASFQARS